MDRIEMGGGVNLVNIQSWAENEASLALQRHHDYSYAVSQHPIYDFKLYGVIKSMVQYNFIARCPNCRAKNRIPPSRASQQGVCGKCRTPLPRPAAFPEYPVEVTDQTFGREVLGFSGPLAALFWAPWCGHCARLMPGFDELASEFSGYIKFAKIELDKNPGTTSQYQVQSVPVLIFFKGGRIVNRVLGAVPKYQIEHHLKALL